MLQLDSDSLQRLKPTQIYKGFHLQLETKKLSRVPFEVFYFKVWSERRRTAIKAVYTEG